ncbi:helix-turn-helix domain-containing protein [Mangrovibacterium diazotrophicum]|uniref:AraC family transcriptional regulator n=1 Tax=Mangrovibacterium diazotrophicum TaxID=1261403 RepID=A0A419W3G0_9BACT|nr:helix-turn-helix domain-containing protein [Mangrovibacterium diazotrophicum]RKD90012.1 AraC family transcriptional regulator [Mangrovibacterium diazotrophicum]
MSDIIRLDSVSQFNDLKGIETRHPKVSVFDYVDAKTKFLPDGRYSCGFYSVFLKEAVCGELQYGRNTYDYDLGTLVFVGPGQVLGIKNKTDYEPQGKTLLIHPDFINGTSLAKKMSSYSFFSYEQNEALHLSEREHQIIVDLFQKIDYELDQPFDKHSRTLISNNIETLLNYCLRFYDRQFITREDLNKGMLVHFENLLSDYYDSDKAQTLGLPTVGYFAEKLNLSANYFGDLMKKETGKSAQEHLHLKLIDKAKEKIFDTEKTISQIAYELGFQYPQHFSRLFKNETGYSPNEYRSMN